MRHLVIGASGQVGEQLIKSVVSCKEEAIGTFYKTPLHGWGNHDQFSQNMPPGKNFTLDITKQKDVENLIVDVVPDFIYITAANTRVDYCEEEPGLTRLTNVVGVQNIIRAVKNINGTYRKREPVIVYFSSDYIFSGETGPYSEDDLPNPMCEYGRQKLLAEHYIATRVKHFIIIRTTGIFGPETQGKNFVTRLVKNLREGKEALIPLNEIGTPTYAPDLAEAVLKIINNIGTNYRTNTSQIVNVAGPDPITRYEFAKLAANIFECNPEMIKGVYSEEIKRAAKRPLKAGLTTDRLDSMVDGKLRSYIDAFKEMAKIKYL